MPNWLKAPLVLTLVLVMVTPIEAESLQTAGRQLTAAIVVVAAAAVVVIVLVAVHHGNSHASITGCVSAGAGGLILASESDRRVYRLTGDSGSIKPGERVTVEGKRQRSGDSRVLEVHRLRRDFGACRA
jgi:hypothetical protein